MPPTIALVHGDVSAPASRPDSASPDLPTWGEMFDERAPLIGTPAFFGPPIIFVLGPWLLVVLLLIGPAALILTALLILVGAAALIAVLMAVIASPYLLVRHLHAHGAVHTVRVRAKSRAPLRLLRKYRVGSGRLDSPQPKGMS